jgi:indolepyruvate ferredoxin oxidoreductase
MSLDLELRPATDLMAVRYRHDSGQAHLTGVQALVRVVLDVRRSDQLAGRNTAAYVSGYEGSPLGGFDLELARLAGLLTGLGVTFRPAVNEELAATAVMGSQLAGSRPDALVEGVTGFWYGKSPGVDRACDALRHANLAGSHPDGGAVAFVGDDTSAKSSTVPGASEALLADLGMPVLYPADSQDILDLGQHAVSMSRSSGLWVALKVVTAVADGASAAEFGPGRIIPVAPRLPGLRSWRHTPNARLLQPVIGELEQTLTGIRLQTAVAYAEANKLDRVTTPAGPARVGVIAAGSTYSATLQSLRRLGIDDAEAARRGLRLLKLAQIHPLVPSVISQFADGLDEIIVVEDKRGLIETGVAAILYPSPRRPRLSGKRDPAGNELFPAHGELDADKITTVLARRLAALGDFPSAEGFVQSGSLPPGARPITLTARTPYFCSGCPHNTSTRVPDGSVVGAGIGCHALALTVAPERTGDIVGISAMGGEGATWIGMESFVSAGHFFQNLGDGTFFHSGSLAVRAAVAAKVNITYKLLWNSAVAMTGGQQAQGARDVPELCRLLRAEGVTRIVVTAPEPRDVSYRHQLPPHVSVVHRDRLIEVQKELAAVPGVTALIHDQECATELRRKRKRGLAATPPARAMINERVCEGCGDCGTRSNCLSLQPATTQFGRKTRIDQSSCNLDFSCIDGDCPSFLSVRPGKASGKALPVPPAPALAEQAVSLRPEFNIRITGIGGSGIVTLSQILTRAASLAGYHVRGLDQTGLAQKGGPVVSDVRFGTGPVDGNRTVAGECDLYLGCDALVAAEPRHLEVADAARTVAIVSLSPVATGPMVLDITQKLPDPEIISAVIGARTKDGAGRFLDARRAASAILGHDQYANLLLAGVAFEAGALPIPAEAIEAAIADNGAEAERNIAAFRFGRLAVADPERFAAAERGQAISEATAATGSATAERVRQLLGPDASPQLAELASHRAAELASYQNQAYADHYLSAVAATLQRDPGDGSDRLVTIAVARHLYTLMAYKDEYEVARLSLDPALTAAVEREFGAGARVSYRLHPPMLRALGMKQKITFGPWFRGVFRLLAAGRRLRGTPLDLFGYTRLRRAERQLADEYLREVTSALGEPGSAGGGYAHVLEVAETGGLIRGYEEMKLASIGKFRTAVRELQSSRSV